MKHNALWVGLFSLLVAGCNDDPTNPVDALDDAVVTQPEIDDVTLDRRAPAAATLRSLFFKATREDLGSGIAHYRFEVPLGPGAFDVVRLHRVVRERKSHFPVRTKGAVFMTHGASLQFEAIFLRAGASDVNTATSVAVNLAANGIDVWGMDFAWTLVPVETTDFAFMRDWGVERDVDHTLAAMSVARLIRGLTRQGFGKLNLLGYSYGVGVAYAAAGRETQQRPYLRDIRGIIAVDQAMKFPTETARLVSCAGAAGIQDLLDAGVYQNADGIVFGTFGELAATAPDEPSPLVPGFTNRQALLFVGTSTFVLGPTPAPFFHFVGGAFDATGIPVGLLYADPARWTTLSTALPPYMPERARFDLRTSQCDEADTSIDDHLHEISVPILYLNAAGGFGPLGDHTGSLTASPDVTNVNIQVQPDGQEATDYGHADLFLGNDAADLVWDGLRRWLVDHSGQRPRGPKRRDQVTP